MAEATAGAEAFANSLRSGAEALRRLLADSLVVALVAALLLVASRHLRWFWAVGAVSPASRFRWYQLSKVPTTGRPLWLDPNSRSRKKTPRLDPRFPRSLIPTGLHPHLAAFFHARQLAQVRRPPKRDRT